jgi:hypothetical protein
MTNYLRRSHHLLLVTTMSLVVAMTINTSHAKKPNCNDDPPHPSCGDDGGGGNAEPQVVYWDDGFFLANAEGTSQTEIRTGGRGPKLDAPGQRVLFIDTDNVSGDRWLRMISYDFLDGNIDVGQEQVLVTLDGIDGSLSSEGVSDWSPDGSKYSYSYWTGINSLAVYRMMIAPDPDSVTPDPILFPDGNHMLAYESEPNGGLNSATWDQSGNFIYHSDSPVNVPFINGLFVIDVRTPPGKTIAVLDLGPIMVASAFAEESNVQLVSASSITGDYSFDPLNGVPASNNSLCLMVSTIDWSAGGKHHPRFVHIIDLPGIFDPGSNLHCPIATGTSPILDFLGTDFTTNDTGIVGRDYRKHTRGVWVYDVESESRTKIIDIGSSPDWSN